MSYLVIKRILDILLSALGLIILSPLFLAVSLAIVLESKGGIFYLQTRVGKNRKHFKLIKFRSMRSDADRTGLLTIGRDQRITKVGQLIRTAKIDELPQLINVIKGEMSLVGPRPEVPRYVDMYNERQLEVLVVRPGITDLASIKYYKESLLLGQADDPENVYINRIMPDKLELNLEYIRNMNILTDVRIIFRTIGRILLK